MDLHFSKHILERRKPPPMGETFLGGVASPYIGRLANDALRDGFTTRGYGPYFTDSHLIGVPYKKITSRTFRPAYVISLIWIVSLVSLVAYAVLTGAQQLYPLPAVMGLVPVALAFLVYLSPRQATNRTRRQEATSINDLVDQPQDLVLERSNISQVTYQFPMISILMKSGEWYYFGVGSWGSGYGHSRKRLTVLLSLFQRFCSQSPPISMFDRRRNQVEILSKGEIAS